MQMRAVQEKVRELITETDHLSRHAHAARSLRDAAVFAALRTSLLRVERDLGASRHSLLGGEIDLLYQRVRDAAARVREDQRAELGPLLASAEALYAQLPWPTFAKRGRSLRSFLAALRAEPLRAVAFAAAAFVFAGATFCAVKSVVRAFNG